MRRNRSKPFGAPEGTDSQLQDRPVIDNYATEAYQADIAEAKVTRTDDYKYRNTHVAQRVLKTREMLDAGKLTDKIGESTWFINECKDGAASTFTVTANGVGCTITGAGTFSSGDTCTLVASPLTGYTLDASSWSGLPASASVSTDFTTATWTVDANVTCTCTATVVSTSYIKFSGTATNASGNFLFDEISFESGSGMEISDDGTTWSAWDGTAWTVTSGVCYVRGKQTSTTPIYGFAGNFEKVEGKLMSLVDYENPDSVVLSKEQFCTTIYGGLATEEAGLFYAKAAPSSPSAKCTYLEDASGLVMPSSAQVETGSEYALSLMFNRCIALKTSGMPTLATPAIANGLYDCMFFGCTSLTSIPDHLLDGTFTSTPGVAAYSFMFSGCTGLTSLPNNLLNGTNAENLGGWFWSDVKYGYQSAYSEMFSNCTGLTDLSSFVLPATVMTECCYGHMFYGCTSLTSAPALSATTLAAGCYKGMFYGCTKLTNPPVLSVTSLPEGSWSGSQSGQNRGCYQSMFEQCYDATASTGLVNPPALPATTLGSDCYKDMFSGCKLIADASNVLPATGLTEVKTFAMHNMFADCEALVTAPTLKNVTVIGASGCVTMFANCYALTGPVYIPVTPCSDVEGCKSMFTTAGSATGAGGQLITTGNITDWNYSGQDIYNDSYWTVSNP